MSPRTRKILFGVMFVWFVGLFLLWRWTGDVPENVNDTRPREAMAPVRPRPPAPEPVPEPPAPADPLAGYAPCRGTGQGRGSFGSVDGYYDDSGRFVLTLAFGGRTGAISGHESLHRASRNVVYLDFQGDIPFSQENLRPSGGPVERVRLGRHRGFTRVSVNFRAREAPEQVRAEVLCREGSVALRLAWGEALSLPVITETVQGTPAGDPGQGPPSPYGSGPESSGTASPSPLGTGPDGGELPGPVTGTGSASPPQSAMPPVGPAGGPVTEIPGQIPSAGTSGEPVAGAGGSEGASAAGGTGNGAAEGAAAGASGVLGTGGVPGGAGAGSGAAGAVPASGGGATGAEPFVGCRAAGGGRGIFGIPETGWDEASQVFTARLPLVSEEGPGEVKIGNSLGRRRESVTYLDFVGSYRFRKADLPQADGPFRLLRFGRHPGLVRLGFNYRDGRSPDRAPRTEIRCLENAVEVRFGFGPRPQAGPPSVSSSGAAPTGAGAASSAGLAGGTAAAGATAAGLAGSTASARSSGDGAASEPEQAGADVPAPSGGVTAAGTPDFEPPAGDASAVTGAGGAAPETPYAGSPEGDAAAVTGPAGPGEGDAAAPAPDGDATAAGPDRAPAGGREGTGPVPPAGMPAYAAPVAAPAVPSARTPSEEGYGASAGLAPCRGKGEGSGTLGTPSVELAVPDRVTVTLPLESRDGPGSVTSGHALGQRSGNVSFLDIRGRYDAGTRYLAVNRGPAGILRIGEHPGFTRISLNWLEGRVPESVAAELLCRDGEIVATFRIGGEDALRSFPEPQDPASGPEQPAAPVSGGREGTPAGPVSGAGQAAGLPTPAESLFPESSGPDFPPVPEPPLAEPSAAPSGGTDAALPAGADAALPAGADAAMPLLPGEIPLDGRTDAVPPSASRDFPVPDIGDGADAGAGTGPAAPEAPDGTAARDGGLSPEEPGPPVGSETALPTEPGDRPRTSESGRAPGRETSATPDGTGASEAFGTSEPPGGQVSAGAAGASGTVAADVSAGDAAAPGTPPTGGTPDGEAGEPVPAYAACAGSGAGRGTFGAFGGSEDGEGRFVLELPFSGTLGSVRTSSQVNLSTGNVTVVDFTGSFRARVTDERLEGGPVGRVRIGFHEGSARLSLNWRDSAAPVKVEAEVLCRTGSVAVRLAYEGAVAE